MGSRRINLIIVLIVLALLAGSGLAITSKDTKLGLDLRGGTQLIFEARGTPQNPEPQAEDIDRAIDIVRSRVDQLGVAEPEISRLGATSLQVSLPDIQEIERAREQVGTTAQLFFYDLEPNIVTPQPDQEIQGSDDVSSATLPRLYDAVRLAAEQEPECWQDACTAEGSEFYVFERGTTKELLGGPSDSLEDLLDQTEVRDVPPRQREVVEVPQGTIVVRDELSAAPAGDDAPAAERYLVLRDRPELSGDDIRNPEQNFDPQTNAPNVTFDFSDQGRRQFQEVTQRIALRGLTTLQNNSFAVVLDDRIVSRPIIDFEENPGGIDGRTGAQISGGFSIQEAQDLANNLRIGALPVELELISQSTVSATLGQQALDQGLRAGVIGLLLVLVFLILYYRFLGVVAALGLLTYAALFFAMIKLIPITLTLPGIAGLILTIGIAADSNIVIFERIKEEVRRGHSMLSAITAGYRRGIGTIIDANVITLLTAFILFGLATGNVKGFAFTLGVGVMVALFTAVVFTRAVLGLLSRSRILTSPRALGAGGEGMRWHFDFAGKSKWLFSTSGLILTIGALAIAISQFNFGIDFESGTRIKASLAQEASVADVRESMGRAGVEDPRAAKIQEVQEEEAGAALSIFQIQAKIGPEQVGLVQRQLERDFGLAEVADDETGGFESQSVGPTFGEQVARSAVWAVAFSLLLISAYVAFRFEPKYAVPVLIAVIHDLLITAGIYSLVGREVSSATVAALLTVLGLSLYDTVIVFDRIRENVPRLPRATFAQIANRSLSEVLTRSLVTSLTTLFAVGVILVFGGETLSDFAFAMLIGLFSGFYSSLFIATPVLIAWKDREPGYRARSARIREVMGAVPAFPEDNIVAKLGDEELAPEAAEAAVAGDGHRSEPEEGEPVRSGARSRELGSGEGEGDGAESGLELSAEESAERERKRELRRERKKRRDARRRKHGRHR